MARVACLWNSAWRRQCSSKGHESAEYLYSRTSRSGKAEFSGGALAGEGFGGGGGGAREGDDVIFRVVRS
ncbi:MAG: hypothetical protein QXJ68_07365 [Methanocellales archaeon]